MKLQKSLMEISSFRIMGVPADRLEALLADINDLPGVAVALHGVHATDNIFVTCTQPSKRKTVMALVREML